MEQIQWSDFCKVEIRVGRVICADRFPEARKAAYKLKIDFGGEVGVRRSSAQITALYPLESLIGKPVFAVVNLPDKQIGPIVSQCLVVGFHDAFGNVSLCVPEHLVPLGTKLM